MSGIDLSPRPDVATRLLAGVTVPHSVFPLAKAREAFGQGLGGGRPGKVVLRVVE